MARQDDLIGAVFTRLTVVGRAESNARKERRWICRCECGKVINVPGYRLKSGNTKSCGCYAKQVLPEKRRRIDITGQRFGSLIVLGRAEVPEHLKYARSPIWRCVCDCGSETLSAYSWLMRGQKKSCGCGCNTYKRKAVENAVGRKLEDREAWVFLDGDNRNFAKNNIAIVPIAVKNNLYNKGLMFDNQPELQKTAIAYLMLSRTVYKKEHPDELCNL